VTVAWVVFGALVVGMLALDLGVVNRRAHEPTFKESAFWSAVWIGLAAVFAAGVFWRFGEEAALEFAAAYVVEKSLSVDNLFVFAAIFSAFSIPRALQHRVLFWGVVGALLLRAVFIFTGVALLARFHWLLYVFGALLIVLGVKLLFEKPGEEHPEDGVVVRAARKVLPLAPLDGARFWTRRDGRAAATPLFLALLAAESADLLFALDSIPAVFAISEDPFILYTSNVFAILGLRSLYALLASAIARLRHLRIGLAAVLVFVGFKLLAAPYLHIGTGLSLAIIAVLLLAAIGASLLPAQRGATEP
jgi:tellurite resistance protein TerC